MLEFSVHDRLIALIVLDVQLPKIDGFEVLELIPDGITVVFVTAYDEYALRAFEVHAADYLLKPFSAARFAEALRQLRHQQQTGEHHRHGLPG